MQRTGTSKLHQQKPEHGLLQTMIEDAIDTLQGTGRPSISKKDVLDFLFSKRRMDPEAAYLAKRIGPKISRCLENRRAEKWNH